MRLNYFLSILIIIVSSIMLFIGIWCFRKKTVKGARIFSVLIFAMVIHSFGYAFELIGSDLNTMLMCIRLEYIGVSFYPFLLLVFTSEYTDEHRFANKLVRAVYLALNIATFFIVQTNDNHHIYYKSVDVGTPYGFPVLILEMGIWYGIQSILLFSSALYSVIIFIHRIIYLDSSAKKRAGFLLAGILIPCIIAILYMLEILPEHIDFSPISYFFLVINYMTGLFRYRLFLVSELSHEMILDTIEEAVIVISDDGHVININASVSDYFYPLNNVSTGDNLSNFPELEQILRKQGSKELHVGNKYFQLKIIPYKQQQCTLYVFSDITERTEVKLQLEKLAVTDPLTGIYNRRYFIDEYEKKIKEALRYGYPLSVIMLDIDDFKSINDKYGHKQGDEALSRLTEICLENLREIDLFARYGGEEFVILLPHTECRKAFEIAERLRNGVINDGETGFTISLGISCISGNTEADPERLITESDEAMYASKSNGKNRTTIYNNTALNG